MVNPSIATHGLGEHGLLAITTLNGFGLWLGDKPIADRLSRRAQALLVYLACTRQAHPRDTLAELLWNDRTQEQAASNLRVLLVELRRELAAHLNITRQTVGLDMRAVCPLDVAELEAALNAIKPPIGSGHLTPVQREEVNKAIGLYSGHFMRGFYVPRCPNFDRWLTFERARLHQTAVGVLRMLVTDYLNVGIPDAVIPYVARLLELDPLAEGTHRQMMLLLARTGQRSAALAHYDACTRLLYEELGVAPERETVELYKSIRAGMIAPLTSPIPSTPHRQLPSSLTPFVGRVSELAQITTQLVDPDCRLLTLTGAGGIGKTRLAIRAAEQTTTFPDGVFFISLASIDALDMIVPAIASALHFAFYTPEDAKIQLLNYLHSKGMLLVMDNVEHLLDSASLFTDILAHAPGIKLLVTSRQRLSVYGEWVIHVPGLMFPNDNSTENVADYTAVQLFVQAARRVHPKFDLADEQDAVIRICQLVDGLPLGIELTAAWVHLIPCRQIAAQLERSIDVLQTSLRDVSERHRDMRAVFEHSWNLLSEAEQTVLQKLSVFRGGFTRAAAEHIAGATLPMLEALVDKSMVEANRSGYYGLHALLRQYAVEKLAASGQAEHTCRRHFDFFRELVEDGEAKMNCADQIDWMVRFQADYDNLCAALDWCDFQGDHLEAGLQMAGDMAWFWALTNRLQEGYNYLVRLLTQSRLEDSAARAWAEHGVAMLLFYRTDYSASRAHVDECVRIARKLGNARRLLAQGLMGAGAILVAQNLPQVAILLMDEVAELTRHLSYPVAQAQLVQVLGQAHLILHNDSIAQSLFEKELHVGQQTGARWFIGVASYYLGMLQFRRGDLEAACLRLQEAWSNLQVIQQKSVFIVVMRLQAEVLCAQGEYDRARQLYQETLVICIDLGITLYGAACLYDLGQLALRQGDSGQAKVNYNEALALYKQVDNPGGIDACLAALSELAGVGDSFDL